MKIFKAIPVEVGSAQPLSAQLATVQSAFAQFVAVHSETVWLASAQSAFELPEVFVGKVVMLLLSGMQSFHLPWT